MLDIKKRFGKNAVLKGMNLQEGASIAIDDILEITFSDNNMQEDPLQE